MGFLTNLLKRYPKRDEWASISHIIAVGLQNARKEWFLDICVNQIQSFYKCFETPPGPLNLELSDQIPLTLKAFQLCTIPGFFEEHRYIRKSQTIYFGELIVAEVCGTEVSEIDKIADEFTQVLPDMRWFHLARRVAEHLTGRKAPLPETALLLGMVHAFVILNHLVVASAFGDKTMMVTLDKRMDRWLSGLNDHFLRLQELMTKMGKAA
jgi:hypothetical protein